MREMLRTALDVAHTLLLAIPILIGVVLVFALIGGPLNALVLVWGLFDWISNVLGGVLGKLILFVCICVVIDGVCKWGKDLLDTNREIASRLKQDDEAGR
jgi:hypothetical protein